MTEPESTLPFTPLAAPAPRRRRLRRFFLRHLPLSLAGLVALAAISIVILYVWASSPRFEGFVRKRIIAQIEQSTGGRVEINFFHWDLLHLEADADGLVIHGLEAPGEAPYARIQHLQVKFTLLGMWSPSLLLRSLDVSQPGFHLILYEDGSTNQPQPRKPSRQGKPVLDTLFDLQAGHVSVEQGVLDIENRASSFDFQNRWALLDFEASDVSLLIRFVPAAGGFPESYRIRAGATDLNLSRGTKQNTHGFMEATVDLTRSAAYLRSLRITSKGRASKGHGARDQALEVSGSLHDFAHPVWQARVAGNLDMELLDPIFGYPFAPEGIAHLDLDSEGHAGEFRVDGTIHIDNGSYIGTGVIATGIRLDARVHADANRLLLTSIVAHLRQGGELAGEVSLAPWLPNIPGTAELQPSGISVVRAAPEETRSPIVHPPPIDILVNGKVTAQFKDVSLDTLLDMVGQAPFQRLGLDARVNGPANATWTHGDQATVVVGATFNLSPSSQPVTNEVPTNGSVDATYTHRDGAVDMRKLEIHTPASELEARGHLGAYPLTSPSAFAVDFHSRDLNEFDAVLRDLGLNRYGKTGAAAMPISLAGQLDFLHGAWTGSLAVPRIAGSLKATQLSIEMLPIQPTPNAKEAHPQTVQPKLVRWDTVDLTGSYAPERITIEHGRLHRGKAEITLNGTLDAAPGRGSIPEAFDTKSTLHLRLNAEKVGLEDLLPLTGQDWPLTGLLNTQFQLDGPVHALGGAGWLELDGATVYGEPVARLRAQGTMANQVFKLDSISVTDAAGGLAASGSFDMKSRRFQLNSHASGIDIAKIDCQHRMNLEATGKLAFTATGSGTLDDPRLEAHATLSDLALGGQSMGDLVLAAHTANRSILYDATTRFEGTEVDLNGQTALTGDYATQAKVEFSQFNIGALLKMAHVESISGESALAGTVTVEGPLARLEQLHGDVSLGEVAVTVAGVHLKSAGRVHATLANGLLSLDPLHVTGEDTDLRGQGSVMLKGKRQLDLAASGSVNLKLAETLDPDLTASGITTFQLEAHGPLKSPDLQGRIDFQNGSLSLEDVPNGLSQLHGTLVFNQNQLEVKSLTAMSGGGLLSVGGSLAYQHGIYADLSVQGNGIRIRYPQGVSSLADATFRLQGSQNNLLLSGDVLITRFTVSPDLDIAALASQANAVQTIAPPDAPSNHIRLDVHIASSPQLNFQNAYAKLAGDVDLHLRGTVASPSLLGRVSITEGSATIAGTRYDLQRGDILFTNPVRIEPTIDLDATARVEDYDITLGIHGTPEKPAVTWRSDPPLPEADVVALLALGRTGSQQRLYTQQQEQSLTNPTTDALLGGALNATVSSRVQKLFGAGSVKVDPNYLGALGNSTSRIIVEEQLGRNLALTYATNVNTTQQQLIQAEVAINRHVSLVVARDESGVFSIVVKATRRFR
jgi:translocation and assembly module TamB